MYEYATGLIRVLDKKILDQTDFDRMLGAKNAEQAFKVLNDTDYGDNLLNLKPEDFEKALERDNKDLRKLFGKIIESKLLLKFLFLKNDFLELKYYLKIKFGKIDTNKKSKVKKSLAEPVLLKLEKLNKITPRKIDEICDSELYKARQGLARKMRDKFLQEICKKDLDLNFDLEQIKLQARNYAYGSPIILEYFFKKVDAGRKIRIIMNAKLNNIAQEDLEKHL